tara:strand:- start:536 stop:850 length:315 start_codon:yes stop_codon:yes gene_type:complete
MFGKFIISSIALVSAAAFAAPAEVEIKVMCDNASEMLPWFKAEHGEEPIWIGSSNSVKGAQAALVVNPETRTWSFVLFNDTAACLIESGEGFKQSIPKLPGNGV